MPPEHDIDLIDEKTLRALAADGRLSFVDAAQETVRPPDFAGFSRGRDSGCAFSRVRQNSSECCARRRFLEIVGSV
jgi:hypothetical protein